MFNHGIDAQLMALESAGIILGHRYYDAKKVLEEYWKDKIAVVWEVDDVLWQAGQQGKIVTEDDAREILNKILHKHDANMGVNWDTISYYLEDYPDDPNAGNEDEEGEENEND